MAGELMAHSYAGQYGLAVTALRFFTVYGPWGRPDMAIFKFTRAILNGKPIELYAGGTPRRDFTYVGDTVQGIVAAIDRPPADGGTPFRAFNLGRGEPAAVTELVEELEKCLGRRAIRRSVVAQVGDVNITFADIRAAQEELGYRPTTSLREGLREFVAWYQTHYASDDMPLRHSA
jgi:UDP-glucuronate 4-epimerase